MIVYRKPAMRSAINLLLASMAFSDILLASLCMPFSLVTLFTNNWIPGNVVCRLVAFLQTCLTCAGVYILLTISFDRYMIIVRRKDKLTPSRAKLVILVCWSFALVSALPPTIGWGEYRFFPGHVQCILTPCQSTSDIAYAVLVVCITYFLPILIMSYSYACIFKTVHKNAMRIHNHPSTDDFNLTVSQTNDTIGLPTISRRLHVSVNMSFKTRAFKTILILYLVFVVCWTPYAIVTLSTNVTGSTNNVVTTVCLWWGFMNSAINPIIYSLRIKKFREACREIIPKRLRLSNTRLTMTNKRRVNPSSVYEFHEQSVL